MSVSLSCLKASVSYEERSNVHFILGVPVRPFDILEGLDVESPPPSNPILNSTNGFMTPSFVVDPVNPLTANLIEKTSPSPIPFKEPS